MIKIDTGIVSTRLMGGLGNMMFQIAAAYSISIRDGKKFVSYTKDMVIPHKSYSSYIDNIFRKVQFTDTFDIEYYLGCGFEYYEPPKVDGNLLLVGHFQSEKWFLGYRKEIIDLFEIDDNTKELINEKYPNILEQDTCSIHVRRGDYVNQQNFHPVQSIDYFKSAINLIGENNHFVIFSDDIMWCEENFVFLKNKTFVSGNLDFQDMYLMSMCKNNIVANSTFSWWGAWLNQNENKKVVVPSKWFGDSYSHFKTDDIYCENWIKL